jgi:hypothetical protein
LAAHKGALVGPLWDVLWDAEDPKRRFRAACVLAAYDPAGGNGRQNWAAVAERVAGALLDDVREDPGHYGLLVKTLRPVREHLIPPLSEVYRDQQGSESRREFATKILADYADKQADTLAGLVMDADEKQFRFLYPKLRDCGDDGAPLLRAELGKRLGPQWDDPPPPPSWEKPHRALVQKIEAAHGLLDERFAFCQTMPLEEFRAVAEGLRLCGYRPTRFRPYAAGGALRVAAVWTRDGKGWDLADGLSAEALRQRAAEPRMQQYQPVDVAGYIDAGQERYAAVWLLAPARTDETQLEVGLDRGQLKARDDALRGKGYWRSVYAVLPTGAARISYSALWTRPRGRSVPVQSPDSRYDGSEAGYARGNFPADLQVDVQVSRADTPRGTRERYAQELRDARQELQAKPDDAGARWRRGRAHFHLAEIDKALEDLSWVIGQSPQDAGDYQPGAYQFRAIAHARLGKPKEAKDDLAKCRDLGIPPDSQAFVEAAVSAYLGDDAKGMERLEEGIAAHDKQAAFLYQAACAYSLASHAAAGKELAPVYAERAVALLEKAVAHGYTEYAALQTNPFLDPIRERADFVALLRAGKPERRYTALWHPVAAGLSSAGESGLNPADHLARCRDWIGQGYRPWSLSVAEVRAGQDVLAASVWHRPVVPEEARDKLAKRQVNAAVALLKMDQPESAWPLLRYGLDPRVRSYLIHRLSPLGADPKAFVKRVKRWDEEPDLSARRALLLILGEFGEKELPRDVRDELIQILLDVYHDDPDGGIHASAAWLLGQWGRRAQLREMEQRWAQDNLKREARLDQIKQELARGKDRGGSRWYVNCQGQTMMIVPGPAEFVMGSPRAEADREGGAAGHMETQRRVRIGRSFALAAHEVTVEQFLRFREDHLYDQMYARTEDCPMNNVTWFQAAKYCNWLSEKEGIPPAQWCYEPHPAEGFAAGMRLKAHYLELTGYRLPSAAEWEYACRAGTVTSRHYGETAELLDRYAWYANNAAAVLHPVGLLRPNDWGLFDMLGNVVEWCQDVPLPAYSPERLGRPGEDREQEPDILGGVFRVSRGGAFDHGPGSARSAYENRGYPRNSNFDAGFRPARTFP